MDVARLNLSHGSYAVHDEVYRNVRQAADEAGRGVGILVDLQGPKIRLGSFAGGPQLLQNGARFTITTEDVPGDVELCSTTYRVCPATSRSATASSSTTARSASRSWRSTVPAWSPR